MEAPIVFGLKRPASEGLAAGAGIGGGGSFGVAQTVTTGVTNTDHTHNFSATSGAPSVTHTHALNFTSGADGGTETRPLTLVVLTCIKT